MMKLPTVALLLVFPLTAGTAAQLVADKAHGCKVVDEEAAPDRTMRWTGPCAGGTASGQGTAEFLQGDVVVRKVEGTFEQGVAVGAMKVSRFKNGTLSTVTEFSRGNGADESLQKVTFYRDGAVSSIESGKWSGGKLNGECAVERYRDGKIAKSYSGTCINGSPAGPAKVRIYESSPGHDMLFEGFYANGKLDGQGQSSEVLTAAAASPAESCLQPGAVTWHYDGAWTANALNGHGVIEWHFCSATSDGTVHHIDMKATGNWIDGAQDGEVLTEYVADGGAPVKVTRVFDHGALVSEALADAPAADTPAKKKEALTGKEALCKSTPWLCNEHTFDAAPFAK